MIADGHIRKSSKKRQDSNGCRVVSAWALLAVAALSLYPIASKAQVVPPSADIDRMQIPERTRDARESDKPQDEGIHTPEYHSQPRPANADAVVFRLNSLRVEGVSAFPEPQIRAFYGDSVGQDVSLARIYDIADAITRHYRDAGYVLAMAYVPPQEIDGGDVVIRVVEGRIGDVVIEGEGFLGSRIVQAAVNEMREAGLVRITHIESWLLRLNDLQGGKFRILLRKGEREGEVVLVLVGEESPRFAGGFAFDNSGSRFLGPFVATGWVDFLHGPEYGFQRTRITASTSLPTDELNYLGASHVVPLDHEGLSLAFDASYSAGAPGYTLEPSEVESRSFGGAARVDWQFLRQRDSESKMSFGAQFLNSETEVLGIPFTEDRIRKAFISQNFRGLDGFGGFIVADVSLHKGLDGLLGASEAGELNLSRAEGEPGFVKAVASVSRTQSLVKGFTLMTRLDAQYSPDSLLSSEEFGFGGFDMGRAYDPSELSGDSGVNIAAELRYDGLKPMASVQLQPYIFADFGNIWNHDTVSESSVSASSAGVGTRLYTDGGYAADLAVAIPVTRERATPEPWENESGARILFRISKSF